MSNFNAAINSISTVVENIRESTKRPFQQVAGAESSYQNSGGRGHGCGNQGGNGGHGGMVAEDKAAEDVESLGLNPSLYDGISNIK
jgi:hypothetical protein